MLWYTFLAAILPRLERSISLSITSPICASGLRIFALSMWICVAGSATLSVTVSNAHDFSAPDLGLISIFRS